MTWRLAGWMLALALFAFVLGAVFARYQQTGVAPVWLNTLVGCG